MNIRTENIVSCLNPPEQTVPLVADSPHSGDIYPDDFGYACPLHWLRETEDAYVHDIFGAAPDFGIPLLAALFPRSYIDVNRAPDDIDAKLLNQPWPNSIRPSPRAEMGTGLIRRVYKAHAPHAIYDRYLSVEEVMHRLKCYYHPYHNTLQNLLDETHARFGKVYHLNLHSMPETAGLDSDVVLGDRDGTSCHADFTRGVGEFLVGLGYRVAYNNPYKGVEIVRRYGRPREQRHSLQIELRRSLYMNERTREKSANYAALRQDMTALLKHISELIIT